MLIIHHVVIELTVVVLVLGLANSDGILRVSVQHTRNHLRNDVAPLVLVAKRQEQFLDGIQHRTQIVLGILEEGQQQFRGAVASAATHTRDRAVQVVHMVDDCLDGIAEGQLLVVVTMETELLILHDSLIAGQFLIDIFLIEGAKAIHQIKHVSLAFFLHLMKSLVQFRAAIAAHRHDVEGGLVTHFVEGIHHADTLVNILHVACHAEHLVGAFGSGLHGVHVDAAHVSHHGHLHLGFDAVLHFPQQIVVAELPRAIFLGVKKFGRVLVAHLHVVDTGSREEGVEATHKFQREIVLVHQAAVADGAVENFNGFVVHNLVVSRA